MRVRLVGSGLGRSRGRGCSFPSSHTRLLSLKKGKDRVTELPGERRGVPEGDVRPGSAMSNVIKRRRTGEDDADRTADTAFCLLVYLLVSLLRAAHLNLGNRTGRNPGQCCRLRSGKRTCCEERQRTERWRSCYILAWWQSIQTPRSMLKPET